MLKNRQPSEPQAAFWQGLVGNNEEAALSF